VLGQLLHVDRLHRLQLGRVLEPILRISFWTDFTYNFLYWDM
jgi:hypothetical protein